MPRPTATASSQPTQPAGRAPRAAPNPIHLPVVPEEGVNPDIERLHRAGLSEQRWIATDTGPHIALYRHVRPGMAEARGSREQPEPAGVGAWFAGVERAWPTTPDGDRARDAMRRFRAAAGHLIRETDCAGIPAEHAADPASLIAAVMDRTRGDRARCADIGLAGCRASMSYAAGCAIAAVAAAGSGTLRERLAAGGAACRAAGAAGVIERTLEVLEPDDHARIAALLDGSRESLAEAQAGLVAAFGTPPSSLHAALAASMVVRHTAAPHGARGHGVRHAVRFAAYGRKDGDDGETNDGVLMAPFGGATAPRWRHDRAHGDDVEGLWMAPLDEALFLDSDPRLLGIHFGFGAAPERGTLAIVPIDGSGRTLAPATWERLGQRLLADGGACAALRAVGIADDELHGVCVAAFDPLAVDAYGAFADMVDRRGRSGTPPEQVATEVIRTAADRHDAAALYARWLGDKRLGANRWFRGGITVQSDADTILHGLVDHPPAMLPTSPWSTLHAGDVVGAHEYLVDTPNAMGDDIALVDAVPMRGYRSAERTPDGHRVVPWDAAWPKGHGDDLPASVAADLLARSSARTVVDRDGFFGAPIA